MSKQVKTETFHAICKDGRWFCRCSGIRDALVTLALYDDGNSLNDCYIGLVTATVTTEETIVQLGRKES